MKYIDLISKLSEKDKEILNLYIKKYGCITNFIGLDEWLQNWSHANQKLYRLLGNSFIKEFSFEYTKTQEEMREDLRNLVYESKFKSDYHNFYLKLKDSSEDFQLDNSQMSFFNHLLDYSNFYTNSIHTGIKYKKPNAKKMLQIQKTTKPLKAIYRVIQYFKDDFDWDLEAFENFQKKFGIIYGQKVIKGNVCISIHPMDYITMSDNNSNWSSCMAWITEDSTGGCYHAGTIEMMNSNNVLCCYLKNEDTPFVFDDTINPKTGEVIGVWNNKKWRQLFYFTKDIVMGGKPYPYKSKELTLNILNEIKKLANGNLNYNYDFGPELYKDMVNVYTTYRMNNQKMWAKSKSKKSNIIWDTKGMYNDMFNDHDTDYWCCRNKVAHTKVISVSGKANCLCCNNSIIEFDDDEYYNDRFRNTGNGVCLKCQEDYFSCDCCGYFNSTKKLYVTKEGKKVCEFCLRNKIFFCPCCGKLMNVSLVGEYRFPFLLNRKLYNYIIEKTEGLTEENKKIFLKTELDRLEGSKVFGCYHVMDKETEEYLNEKELKDDRLIAFEQLFICKDCRKKEIENFKNNSITLGKKPRSAWGLQLLQFKNNFLFLVNPDFAEQYRGLNLKKATVEDLAIADWESAS